jgi:dipeptidyl aminopeptidase/acylaminoacyl peptidase
MRKTLLVFFVMAAAHVCAQHVATVREFIDKGTWVLQKPMATDSVDMYGNKQNFVGGTGKEVQFYINNSMYTPARLTVKGASRYETLVDGKRQSATLALEPGHHEVTLKYTLAAGTVDTVSVVVDARHEVECTTQPLRNYTYQDVVDGLRVTNLLVSADGRYAIVGCRNVQKGGRSNSYSEIVDLHTGRTIRDHESFSIEWMPRSAAWFYEDKEGSSRLLRRVDVLTGKNTVIARDVPDGRITMSPTEDYLILSKDERGPVEQGEVYQWLAPDDRKRIYRFRTRLIRYDMATGQSQPLTFGHHSVDLEDISRDGSRLLVSVPRIQLGHRPSTVFDYLTINVRTMAVDTLFCEAAFLNSPRFSPDGKQVLFVGSAEAFDGLGRAKDAGTYSNMYDKQLYVVDLATRHVDCLTRSFHPSVIRAEWSAADGQIYFSANDRDRIGLFAVNAKTKAVRRIDTREEVVREFSLSRAQSVLAYYGVSAMNSVRAYAVNLKNGKSTLLKDCSAILLKDIRLGECRRFAFLSSRGDSIDGRLYLPPGFNPEKKYPMVVNYYGGSTPTSRNFESQYPHPLFASLGYVVYVVNPGGAIGYGQRYSGRHVNTAGRGVAEDIVEGVKAVCRQHPFVDERRIGCIGASYGGFMTQYLLTVTDLFACGVSHAGIANHASYWGCGHWGYSYSEVSMAEKFPWSDPQLFALQSPLFRADKIHTPLLLTHGSSDTNVPVGESIQMFTALKSLGRDVAFVQVRSEDHVIIDYEHRKQWTDVILAWFEKYLKGDGTWWNTLFPDRYY